MPLFVVVVRYGALSRYRCVPAEDERGSLRGTKRYADEFAAVAMLRSTFGPDAVNATIGSVAPFLERAPIAPIIRNADTRVSGGRESSRCKYIRTRSSYNIWNEELRMRPSSPFIDKKINRSKIII